MDGFWLPDALQQQPTFANVGYRTLSYLDGQPAAPDDPRAVTARYPDLQPSDWQALLAGLRGQRTRVPTGAAYWVRLQTALQVAGRRLADPADPLRREILTALPIYTGYSEAMIRMTLAALDMMALDQLPAAYASLPTWQAAAAWQPIPGLPGRLRFYPAATPGWNLARFLRRRQDGPLPGEVTAPELVVGYGAGNVPGTALLIPFLAQATSLADVPRAAARFPPMRPQPTTATPIALTRRPRSCPARPEPGCGHGAAGHRHPQFAPGTAVRAAGSACAGRG